MLRVCTNWCLSTSLRHPFHATTSIGHGVAWKSGRKFARRLCVQDLSVQDEGNAVEALAMDLALKVNYRFPSSAHFGFSKEVELCCN